MVLLETKLTQNNSLDFRGYRIYRSDKGDNKLGKPIIISGLNFVEATTAVVKMNKNDELLVVSVFHQVLKRMFTKVLTL